MYGSPFLLRILIQIAMYYRKREANGSKNASLDLPSDTYLNDRENNLRQHVPNRGALLTKITRQVPVSFFNIFGDARPSILRFMIRLISYGESSVNIPPLAGL